MKTLELEWIEEDDDGLDPNWLTLSFAERVKRIGELRENGLLLLDAFRGTLTPRRMDRTINRFVPLEPS